MRERNGLMMGILTGMIGLCLMASPVFAQGNIHLGKLKIKPGVTYKGEYNDNIYSAPDNEEDDFIHTITPEIAFIYEGNEGNFVEAGYSVDLVAYSDKDENNYQTHKPYIRGSWKSPFGLFVQASDDYMNTADPYGDRNQFGLGIPQTQRWDNTLNMTVGYEFGEKYSVEGSYKNYRIQYDEAKDQWQDRTDNAFGIAFVYKLTPKTAVFAQYRFTDGEYDSQNDGVFDPSRNANWRSDRSQDYQLNDFFIGARFSPKGKLSGEIKLGWGDRDFDNDQDILGNRYEDNNTWVAETTVNYQPTARTRISLNLQREQLGAPDASASSYVDTTVGLSLYQELVRRFSVTLGFDWNNNDYLDEAAGLPSKYFNTYTAKAGVGYQVKKWLNTGLDYTYKKKDSSDVVYENEEYETNSIALTVSARF